MGFLITILVMGITPTLFAQQADSTDRSFFVNPKPRSFIAEPHSERSVKSFAFPSSGIFTTPEKTEYYPLPFKGQYYLDIAVEAYQKEHRKNSWMEQFMHAIAPYLNMQFQFSVYRIYDMPLVDRDNPLFQSHGRDNIGEEEN